MFSSADEIRLSVYIMLDIVLARTKEEEKVDFTIAGRHQLG